MQYIYVVNPIPEKVFCDFTCILHSPLKINALECVGKVCKKTTYTLYLHTSYKNHYYHTSISNCIHLKGCIDSYI